MMKNNVYKGVIAAALMAAMGGVQAEDLGVGVGVRAGLLGAGVEVAKSINENIAVRLGVNSFSQSADQDIDGTRYDAEMDFSSTALMVDWFPFAGSFHLTAGYLSSANELSGSATPAVGTDIGGYTTVGGEKMTTTVELGSGPYFGLGWGNVPAKGFGISLEAGVVQMGTPDVSLTVTGTPVPQSNIDQEVDNMTKDLDGFELYPVVALGVSYGF